VAEARRTGVKQAKRLVCPCGAPVVVEPSAPTPVSDSSHDGPVQPKVMPCPVCARLLVVDDQNIGRVVMNKWRLERRLGQGGMGTVYLATELAVEREVALKFLHAALAEREEYRTRFEQEARIMARVEHPNLATLLGVEREGAVPFLVMRYVKGRPLTRLMKDKHGPFPLVEVVPLVVQMAAALSALHARDYVHRDLKPGNVIVSDEGHVTLLDFGLTRSHNPNLTRPGVALGSPQYMSPEQVMAGALDGRSDLYTLGLLTSELLVGHRPYRDEDTKAMLLQHLNDVPEPANLANSDVPREVADVLLKAMAKKPQDRQPTVEAFVEELVRAAKLPSVQLPRRETAEAMLAAVSRPSPVPSKGADVEVAEVVSPDTLSGLTPEERPAPVKPAPLLPTVVDLPPVPSSEVLVTERVPAWPGEQNATAAVSAWREPTTTARLPDEKTGPVPSDTLDADRKSVV
jgi:serine/threonine-protein kinase